MMQEPGRRYFTLRDASELLPEVISLLRTALEAKSARAQSQADLDAYKKRLVMAGGAFPNSNRIAAYSDRAKSSYQIMKSAVDQIQDLGIEIRDLDQGLIDFPALYRGELVYLCFKLGEDSIAHWHHPNEGFAGRRPISPDFAAQLDSGESS